MWLGVLEGAQIISEVRNLKKILRQACKDHSSKHSVRHEREPNMASMVL